MNEAMFELLSGLPANPVASAEDEDSSYPTSGASNGTLRRELLETVAGRKQGKLPDQLKLERVGTKVLKLGRSFSSFFAFFPSADF